MSSWHRVLSAILATTSITGLSRRAAFSYIFNAKASFCVRRDVTLQSRVSLPRAIGLRGITQRPVFTGSSISRFFPVKQVVLRLHRDKSGPTVTLSGMLHFCKAPLP